MSQIPTEGALDSKTDAKGASKAAKVPEAKTCPSCLSKQFTRFCGECGAQVWVPEPGKPDEVGFGPGQPRRWVLDVSSVAKDDLKALVKGDVEGKTEIQVVDPRLNAKLLAAGAKVVDMLGVRPCRIPVEREMDGTLIQVIIGGVEWKGTMDLTYDEFANVRNMIHNRKMGDIHSRYGNPDVPKKFNFPMLVQRGDRQ